MTKTEQRLADLEHQVASLDGEVAVQRHLIELLLDLRRGVPPSPCVQRPVRHLHAVGGAQ